MENKLALMPPPPPPPPVFCTEFRRQDMTRALRFAAVLLVAAAFFAPFAEAQTVSITSTPNNGTHYVLGEAITTRIVTASITSGATHAAQMKLDIGGVERLAGSTTTHSAGITTVNFSYTVTVDDVDTDGIGIPANAIVGSNWNTGFLPPRVINRNNAALTDQPAHRVIGSAAAISSTNPSYLTGGNLDGATLAIDLTNVTFGSGVTAASFELVSEIPDLSISGVSSVSSGDTTATLTLAFTGDIYNTEGPLAVKVLNAAHSGGLDLTSGAVTVFSLTPPLPSLTIDAPRVVEGASGTTSTLRFTVTMSRTSARPVTVAYEDAGGSLSTAGALCERGADYVAFAPGTLTFAPGTRTRTIDVTVIGDAVDEPAELVVVRLRSAVNATLSISVGVGTITDDDGAYSAARTWTLPLVVAASNPAETGLVRIVNRSGCAGAVAIHAIDDAGRRAGPVALSLGANAAVTFSSRDLEEGNVSKGLDGGVGSGGAGPWRLELRTALDVEALAYVRTAEGFLTSVHESAAEEDVAEEEAGSSMRHSYRVPFFNPGSNRRLQSRLRLVNPGAVAAEVVVTGRDDAGESPGGEVRLTLAAGESRSLGADALEAGGDGLEGSLGDGAGKWRLTVTADRPLRVMSLLRNPSGSLTNVSGAGPEPEGEPPEPEGEGEPPAARTWTLPLVVADADPARTGLVRVVNRSDRAGAVTIHAIDDAGQRAGPVSLSLDANAAVTFNSHDLEEGNASKGLDGGVGNDGAGPWRLELRTALDVEALAYLRTAEGFLTSVHESVAEEEAGSMRYRVPFFNPGSNRVQQSRLRLVNPGGGAAEVVITGRDDAGESPGSEVRLTLVAGEARSLGADVLEEGGDGLDGSLGDGAGKWRLTVSADRPLRVMSLLRNPAGNLTNVSGAGPEPEVEPPPSQ